MRAICKLRPYGIVTTGNSAVSLRCRRFESSSAPTHQSSMTNDVRTKPDADSEGDESCLWLEDGKKHILVMGVFHHSYASALTVQNAINTLKPDTVFLELCPWRGLKLEKIQNAYCKAYHYSPRDVESAAIFSATKLGAKLIYGDVPEPVIKQELKKHDEKLFGLLSSSQISMNELEFNHDGEEKESGIFIGTDSNGKQYILDDDGNQCSLDSREGVRELMRDNAMSPDARRILYDDREKYMIKAMVEAPDCQKMVAIVGMAHLDGIEKFWKDEAFWKDESFWSLKYSKPNKWDVKRYQRLLDTWFQENFDRVPRFLPNWLRMGGD